MYAYAKKRMNKSSPLGTLQALSTHEVSLSLCLFPLHSPHGNCCFPKTGVLFPSLPHTVPGAQDLLRCACSWADEGTSASSAQWLWFTERDLIWFASWTL